MNPEVQILTPNSYSLKLDGKPIGSIRTTKKKSILVEIDANSHLEYALNWIIVRLLNQGEKNISFAGNSLELKPQNIDLLTILNKPHAIEYINFLNKSISGSSLIKINYKLLTNQSFDTSQLENVKCYNKNMDWNAGTASHVEGISYLVNQVETENFIICDYDTAILAKNWDAILLFLLQKNVAVGTEYPHSYQKYIEFPTLFFSAWNTQKWRELNPNLDRNASFDATLPNYSNLKTPDIGNSLPTYFKNQKSNCWQYKQHNGLETYFTYDVPFVTHLGRGSSREFSKHPKSIEWVKLINDNNSKS